jgi:hypothetical protein
MKLVESRPRASVTLGWTPPADSGKSKVTSYRVQLLNNDRGPKLWEDFQQSIPAITSLMIGDLQCGDAYQFRVAAMNAYGISEFSDPTVSKSTPCAPDEPNIYPLTPNNQSVTISWNTIAESDSNGSPIVDYQLQYAAVSNDAKPAWIDFPHVHAYPATGLHTVTVTGLKNGTPYKFRVASINAFGTGKYAETWGVTPFSTPDKPTNLTARPGFQQGYLSWTPPADNGRPITQYHIKYSTDGGKNWSQPVSTNQSEFVYQGLTIGLSYIFQVAAKNEKGEGPASDSTQPLRVADSGDKYCEINVALVGGLSCQGNDRGWDNAKSRASCSGCGGNMYGSGTYWFSGSYPVTLPNDAKEIDVQAETDPLTASLSNSYFGSGFNRVMLQLGNSTLENAIPTRVINNIDDRGRPTLYPTVTTNEKYKAFAGDINLQPGKNIFKMTVNPIGCVWAQGVSPNYQIYSGPYTVKLKGRYKAAQCNMALEGQDPLETNKIKPLRFPLQK